MNFVAEPEQKVQQILCICCRYIFKEEDIGTAECCPRCGTKMIPADAEDSVALTLTWHEIRILTFSAMNWATQVDSKDASGLSGAIHGIIGEIRRQHPMCPALEMEEELQLLKASHPDTKVYDSEGREVELKKLH